jgi:hypothetical protein
MPVTHWLAGWRLGSFLTADKEGSDVQQGLHCKCSGIVSSSSSNPLAPEGFSFPYLLILTFPFA